MLVEGGTNGSGRLILDLGTGLRLLGEGEPKDGSFRGSALVTHLHWDHVQGLPFFPPIDREGARLDVYAPAQSEGPLAEVFGDLMRPPYFPIRVEELRGHVEFHEVADEEFAIGEAKVRVRRVPHCGPTVGYRVELDGCSMAYVSDHQAPPRLDRVDEAVLELCDGVDVLVHDAQYTEAEFAEKAHWGHCTVGYAVSVAKASGAKRLVLFHHDPAHSDDELDRLAAWARCAGARVGLKEVLAAAEGLVLDLGER